MCKLCDYCHEQRCKAHCKCKRTGTGGASGRKAARGKQDSTDVQSPPPVVAAPVGRSAAPGNELLYTRSWYGRACGKIRSSTEVEMASYQYDNPDIHKELVKKLKGSAPFKLNVYVDKEQLEGKIPKMQKSRLIEL